MRKPVWDTGEFTPPPADLGESADPEYYTVTLKAFVQTKGQVLQFSHGARWPKSLIASTSWAGLAQGVHLWSALEMRMVVKSPVQSTEGKG